MCTSARTRTRNCQKLGTDFYEKEHTKPLFKAQNLLTVHNLYKYTCLLQMFKIIKLEQPKSLLSLFNKSPRKPDYFITPSPSTSFIYMSSSLWNNCRKPINGINFLSFTSSVKRTLKRNLLDMQSRHDTTEWCELNLDSKDLSF